MPETTHPLSVVMILAASACGATGSYLYKTGAASGANTPLGYLTNPRLLGGVACYLAVMILFVAAFRKGGALTVLYPLYATTFIFAAGISLVAFGTPIRPVNLAGMTLLVSGIYLMGKSS
jgi:multidrug transporter EmrE-like cation transporter